MREIIFPSSFSIQIENSFILHTLNNNNLNQSINKQEKYIIKAIPTTIKGAKYTGLSAIQLNCVNKLLYIIGWQCIKYTPNAIGDNKEIIFLNLLLKFIFLNEATKNIADKSIVGEVYEINKSILIPVLPKIILLKLVKSIQIKYPKTPLLNDNLLNKSYFVIYAPNKYNIANHNTEYPLFKFATFDTTWPKQQNTINIKIAPVLNALRGVFSIIKFSIGIKKNKQKYAEKYHNDRIDGISAKKMSFNEMSIPLHTEIAI